MTLTLDPPPVAVPTGIHLRHETPADDPAINALMDRAFGPGRFARTAERLREGNTLRADLSPVAVEGGEIVGACRIWPLRIGTAPALYLGPFAVEDSRRRAGLGTALIGQAVAWARAAQESAILLIGDAPYFAPLGFSIVPPGRVTMPGPVDPARVLWIALQPGALEGLAGPATVLRP